MIKDLNQPVIVRSSRWAGLFWLPLWALFAASWWRSYDGSARDLLIGGLGSVGFAVLAVRTVLDALFPITLAFGPQGLSWGRYGMRRRLAWRDVGRFKAQSVRVVFDYADHYRPEERAGRQFERANRSAEASLPAGLRMQSHELADALNRARERWAA